MVSPNHDIIEISSDSDEEFIIPKRAARKRCQPVKNTHSEAQANPADTYKSNIVSLVDEDVDDAEKTLLPTKQSDTRKQKTMDVLTAPTERLTILPRKPPRKQKMPLQQVQLDDYARDLFNQLNSSVFDKRLPDTELVWNARFCTTAGRAYYHRNNQSITITKIELSSKVVDCEDRVRCVVAHEMCHLAVWILDDDPRERGHGTKFKRWANRVENIRPDIVVKTTHTYDIHYKYRWECTQCGKIYGRHSNSINIEKSACGVCTPPGTLKALFEIPPKGKSVYKGQTTTQGTERQSSNHPQKAETPPSDGEIETLLPKLLNLTV